MREFIIKRGKDENGKYIQIPEECFLELWKLAGGKPDNPLEVKFTHFQYQEKDTPLQIKKAEG